jgi:hypothetical protein
LLSEAERNYLEGLEILLYVLEVMGEYLLIWTCLNGWGGGWMADWMDGWMDRDR